MSRVITLPTTLTLPCTFKTVSSISSILAPGGISTDDVEYSSTGVGGPFSDICWEWTSTKYKSGDPVKSLSRDWLGIQGIGDPLLLTNTGIRLSHNHSRVIVAFEANRIARVLHCWLKKLQDVYVYSVKTKEPNGFLACGAEQHISAIEAKNSRDTLNSRSYTYYAGCQRQGMFYYWLTSCFTKMIG